MCISYFSATWFLATSFALCCALPLCTIQASPETTSKVGAGTVHIVNSVICQLASLEQSLLGEYIEFVLAVSGKKVVRLEYEAYSAMAAEQLRKVCSDVRQKWPVLKMAIVHRIG